MKDMKQGLPQSVRAVRRCTDVNGSTTRTRTFTPCDSRSTGRGRKRRTLDIEQIIASARRPETTVPLCMRGDLQAVWEQLDRDFDAADKEITDEIGRASCRER